MSDTHTTSGRQRATRRAGAVARLRRPAEAARDVAGGLHRPGRADDRAGAHPSVRGCLAVLAIALGSGAAGAINMWYERDIDAVMTRTANRPLPAGPRRARRCAGPRRAAVDLLGAADGAGDQLRRRRAARRRDPVLRLRLHDLAEAPHAAEHRDRRRRRRLPADDRLGRRRPATSSLGRPLALPADLPVDAAALLGAGALSQRRLPPRRRADAAGGGGRRARPRSRCCSTR